MTRARRLLRFAGFAAVLAAATPAVAATPDRVRSQLAEGELSAAQLARLAPDIARHKRCLQSEDARLGSVASDPLTLALTVVGHCRPTLEPMARQMESMGLSREMRARMLARTEQMAAEYIAKRAIARQASAARKP